MKALFMKNWTLLFIALLLLATVSAVQGAASDSVKSHKLIPTVKTSPPTISMKPSGNKLFMHIKPSPKAIEIFSGKRRLTTIKGNNRTQFDVTRYTSMTANGRMLVIVKDKTGKQHKKSLDVSRYIIKPTPAARVNREPVSPNQPARGDRIESIGGNIPMNTPRNGNSATSTGRRPSTSAGMMTQSSSSRLPTEGKARISRIHPQPAIVGKNFTLHGENFGTSKGTVSLEAVGLTLSPTVTRWTDTAVELVVPGGLAPQLGYDNISGRVWLYTAGKTSGATSQLEISPDNDTLPPLIQNAPLSVEPGDEITIKGKHFLMPAGTVSLDCPGGGISTHVSDWSNNRIQVTPASALSKPVESNDCSLVVTNRRNMTARHGIRLNVVLKQKTWRTRASHDFSRRRYSLLPADLENGWAIVDSSFKVEPHYELFERFFWLQQPPVGGRTMRGDIDGELKAGYGRPLGTREITFEFKIEGPAKLSNFE